MKAPLFDDIISLSQNIANASANENDNARELNYKALIKLCANNENTPKDHPLQWEALADFTLDSEQAIDIYQKGLDCAQRLALNNSIASIYLSMAMRYQEMEDVEKAKSYSQMSLELVEQVSNEDLKNDIIEFANSQK
ncbi:hypothetical protein [Thalassotalea profundi]|uniref:Tetratricopeptide repeat protein n=1 Tax=Thalassotalea profundi TaxID=2036687 RepID=A0ABQ3IIL0_9GAMM|nr:hypothetical protein [Thalassotalea profundi]GHE84731.1 hypothetical protein GCM10011501_11930 [Thalassotalea profundi]